MHSPTLNTLRKNFGFKNARRTRNQSRNRAPLKSRPLALTLSRGSISTVSAAKTPVAKTPVTKTPVAKTQKKGVTWNNQSKSKNWMNAAYKLKAKGY